ncbi:PEP-CTERM sorting domain-containing protein [Aeoliella sp. ICT_H6.2]|uniref:PEP-CTERM sorting domain-containing protein n=1 Tax=Aeoliella straminimaris TaxID=2954799 RepID=A0A9X2F9S2_9BACT|nr:PEP-CTERM sorting domain-containing protein [Aeoliella straminimaris]MCO6044253.1 PEP-CTERM sorting domain-containing protein [Aeoliella straminimaris]
MNRVVPLIGALCISLLSSDVYGLPTAYDGFIYPNDGSPLNEQDGGYGWAGPWTEAGDGPGDDFTLTQSETSLDLPNLPFEPAGDSLIATGPGSGGNNNTINRPLAGGYDLAVDQTFYASFLMLKSGSDSSSSDNQEFNLMSGGSQVLRMGSTSGDSFWLGTSSNSIEPITFDATYFLVLKVDALADGSDTASLTVYDSSESIPASEPGVFDTTYSFDSGANINGARFWIGSNASGMFDEVRLGPTWEDVTSVNPNFLIGDFDMIDGITPADYQILSDNLFTGTTYEQGDIDFSGQVDLTDFAMFRRIYLEQGGSLSDLGLVSVPEPSTAALMTVVALGLLVVARKGRQQAGL